MSEKTLSDVVYEAVRESLKEFRQQDDYLLAHGASLMSEDSHEIIHIDTLRRIVQVSTDDLERRLVEAEARKYPPIPADGTALRELGKRLAELLDEDQFNNIEHLLLEAAAGTNRCGCGKPIRYSTPTGEACNKYARCPTYDELVELVKTAEAGTQAAIDAALAEHDRLFGASLRDARAERDLIYAQLAEAQARIAELEKAEAGLLSPEGYDGFITIPLTTLDSYKKWGDQISDLTAKLDAAERDAKRWQYARHRFTRAASVDMSGLHTYTFIGRTIGRGLTVDHAIDAALQGEKP